MGILDDFFDPKSGQLDKLSASPLWNIGLGILANNNQRGSFGAAIGRGGLQGMQAAQEAAQAQQIALLRKQQLDMQKAQFDQQQTQFAQQQKEHQAQQEFLKTWGLPNAPIITSGGYATMPSDGNAPNFNMQKLPDVVTPNAKFDMNTALLKGVQSGAIPMSTYLTMTQKDDTPIALADGASLVKKDGTVIATNAKDKNDKLPSAVQEYNYAKEQGYTGSFMDFQLAQKRAGASNTNIKVDAKLGEGVAGQVGPMLKDSRVATQGAIKMFDAADRLEKAIATGGVNSGPFANQVMTVKQFISNVSGKDNASVQQTRQAIKSLAQMSVEARKQLQGQGQVTEGETAAVAKADAGNIEDLTVPELKDLVTLTKRAAHYSASDYNEQLKTLANDPSTAQLAKFYTIPRIDTLLKHNPELPAAISGTPSIDDLVAKHRTKR